MSGESRFTNGHSVMAFGWKTRVCHTIARKGCMNYVGRARVWEREQFIGPFQHKYSDKGGSFLFYLDCRGTWGQRSGRTCKPESNHTIQVVCVPHHTEHFLSTGRSKVELIHVLSTTFRALSPVSTEQKKPGQVSSFEWRYLQQIPFHLPGLQHSLNKP